MREFQYTASGSTSKVDDFPYKCQHMNIANTKVSPLLNNVSCRPSRFLPRVLLHVIKWCMSSVGRRSNTSTGTRLPALLQNQASNELSPAYLYQNTIRKKIRYDYDR